MPENCRLSVLLLILPLVLLAACASMQSEYPLPKEHPQYAKGESRPPICTDCHASRDDSFDWKRFNHSGYFGEQHRTQAYQDQRVCGICHQRNFCNDCHATRTELKPSVKNQTQTYRRMPHRGDYLGRHRIAGRVDPSSCIRCHGNPKTARTCVSCHR